MSEVTIASGDVVARPWRGDLVLAVMAALEEAFRRTPDYPASPPVGS